MITSNDVQRLFLQSILSRGIVSGKLARLLYAKCVQAVQAAREDLDIPNNESTEAWNKHVIDVNKTLNHLDLEFRRLHDQTTGREMYAIVNTKDNEIAQMATEYTAQEIAFFKVVVEQIMLASHASYSVSSLVALREVSYLQGNMTKTHGENVLGSLVARGWLLKSKRGRYSLSTRSLLELSSYLRSAYPDEAIDCEVCKEIVTRGVACSTPNCTVRVHYHCFVPFRRTEQGRKCRDCSAEWPRDARSLTPIGEEVVKDGQDDGRRRVRRRSNTEGSEAEDQLMDEDEDEDEVEESQSQPSTQPSQTQQKNKGKGKDKRKNVVEDDDNDDEDVGDDDEGAPTTQATTRRRSSRR